MHILHVLDHSIPLHSGYTFRTRAILEQQRLRGWQTSHVTSPKHMLAAKEAPLEEDVDGFRFYRSAPADGVLARLPVLDQWSVASSLTKRLDEVARRLRPDVLHAHSPALNGLAALRVGRRLGIPVVYEVRAFWEDAAVDHGTCREGDLRYRVTRAMETHVFHRADAIATICEGLRADILGRGISQAKVTVIPNAVDLSEFPLSQEADGELAHSLGVDGKPVLGFIGSFYAYEGLTLLMRAMPRILEAVAEARLLLVGGGREDGLLRRMAAELGISDRVVFTGRVPHNQVQRYYDLVTVFVYPRLKMRLTDIVTPLKPLEAMARGRLLVASDVGGHRELIAHGETGLLFPAGDSEALAGTVVGLLQHPERWQAQKEAGRRFVERERSWAASVARYEPVYQRLTQAGPQRA